LRYEFYVSECEHMIDANVNSCSNTDCYQNYVAD